MQHKIMICMTIILIAGLAAAMTESLHAETDERPTLNQLNPNCNPLPDTINVRLRDHYNEWSNTPRDYTAPIEEYAYGVALGELGTTVLEGPNAGQAWDAQVIKAQAIAARTWGAYHCTKWVLPDGRPGVYDGGDDAQFRPYYAGASAATISTFQTQAAVTKGMYMTWDDFLIPTTPYDSSHGKIIDAEFRTDTGNPTCSWNSGNDNRVPCQYLGNTVSGYDYLTSMDNQFAVRTDGPGFGQDSAQGWRKADKKKSSYADILHKYYTGVWIQNDYYANYSEQFYAYNPANQTCGSTLLKPAANVRSINYFWPSRPHDDASLPTDNYCVKWDAQVNFPANDWYTFYILRDDGMRLWIDGSLVLDSWNDSSASLESVAVYLLGGQHTIHLEYYDAGYDAVARLSINRSVGMIGRYYPSVLSKGSGIASGFVMLRPDMPTKFDWVNASPQDTHSGYDPGVTEILSNNFSVIWTGFIYVNGPHDVVFQGKMDDGMYAVYWKQDGTKVDLIDDYVDGGIRTRSATQYLTTGTYKVRVRYYEHTVNAIATFDWWYNDSIPLQEMDTME